MNIGDINGKFSDTITAGSSYPVMRKDTLERSTPPLAAPYQKVTLLDVNDGIYGCGSFTHCFFFNVAQRNDSIYLIVWTNRVVYL